jgi:hypothetical protein
LTRRLVPLAVLLAVLGVAAPAYAAGSTPVDPRTSSVDGGPARTNGLDIAHGRAIYTDDSTAKHPVFLRDVTGGVPGAETQLAESSYGGLVGVSGPYVAFQRFFGGVDYQVYYGRAGGPYRALKAGPGALDVSGHRLVFGRGGVQHSQLVNMTNGHTVLLSDTGLPALSGDWLTTVDHDTRRVVQQNVLTGERAQVLPAVSGPLCDPSACVRDYHVETWGDEVVYSLEVTGRPRVTGLWDFSTHTTTPLPMLQDPSAIYGVAYWDRLLLVAAANRPLTLYDLRHGTSVTVDTEPGDDVALDGTVAGWKHGSSAVVESLHDLLPSYDPQPRYQTMLAYPSLVPWTADGDVWRPTYHLSNDATWSLALADDSGVVRTLTGGTTYGEATPVWDGRDGAGQPVPEGWYTWTLTGHSPGGTALTDATGTHAYVTGRTYVTRSAPPLPALSAPLLASDAGTTATYYPSWSGAPAGWSYVARWAPLADLAATPAWQPFYVGTDTTRKLPATPGRTYAVSVAVVDPSGRVGPYREARTVTPYDDETQSPTPWTFTPSWVRYVSSLRYGGSHHTSGQPGAVVTLTASGSRLWLVGDRGPSYGQFQVSVDGGAWSGWYDAYRTSVAYRQVLYRRDDLAAGNHTVRVRVRGTAGRPTVGVDGMALA